MTNDSQLIAQTFQDMRLFCSDIALLLKTGEEVFKRRGWMVQPDKTCIYAGGYTLERPQSWLPLRFFRYYTRPDQPCDLAYLAIIVVLPQGREREEGMTYLTAGGLTYEKPQGWDKVITSSNTRLFHWHLARRDAEYDGIPTWQPKPFAWAEGSQPSKWTEATAGVESAVTLGLPLHEITDAAQLETRIIEPLLNYLAAAGRDRFADRESP